nr:hypothetical protein [Tanacetum cinerariifolium]
MSSDSASSEEPDSPEAAPTSPDYVLGPEEPEQAPPSPNYVPGYVADSDLEEDSEDGLVDYTADGGDDDDDDSSDDDEEEELLALADSVIAPAFDLVPSSEIREPFETDESAATPPPPPPVDHTTPLGARISIRPQASMPFPSEAKDFLPYLHHHHHRSSHYHHPLQRNDLLGVWLHLHFYHYHSLEYLTHMEPCACTLRVQSCYE